jgi:hypothetical protein
LTSNTRNTMSRNSSAPNADKLYNIPDGLHNFTTHEVDDDCVELYKANYLFMKQSPMYVRLEQKYKNLKKKLREQSKMIELLNRQYFETVEKYAALSALSNQEQRKTAFANISVDVHGLSGHDLPSKVNVPVESTYETPNVVSTKIAQIKIEPTFPKNIPVIDLTLNTDEEPVQDIAVNEVVDVKEVEVVEVDEDETEEVEEVVEEEDTEEVVEVDEDETEEVEEGEEEETEEVEVEVVEEEETEEVEVVEVVEEDETEEVEVVEVVEEDETEEVEVVEEEEEEVVEEEEEEVVEEEEVEVVEEEEEEEEGVYETVIGNKKYYITNETDGDIYAILEDGEIGDVIGKYVNSVPQFTTK